MKQRTEISAEVAAELLFQSNRTCCVCQERGRPVQIHHLDNNPSNNSPINLAVLCLNCHRDTQIRGGFDRKLDARQIVLYKNDWCERVRRRREAAIVFAPSPHPVAAPSEDVDASPRRSSAELNFVNTLPEQRRAAYAQAQGGWETGVTADMMNASYGLVRNLQTYLIGLASFYPRSQFGVSGAEDYFSQVTASRFEWHRRHLEPVGAGTGGTIIGTIASGKVIDDLEQMVIDMVRSLMQDEENFNFTAWLERWNGAA